MDIKFIHDFLYDLADKDMGAFLTHPQIDNALDSSSIGLFNEHKRMYDASHESRDALSPFFRKKLYTSVNEWELPENCEHYLNAIPQYYDNDIGKIVYGVNRIISETELPSRLNSQVKPVTPQKPIVTMIMGERKMKLMWYPTTSTYTGYAYYLIRPKIPYYSFTMNGRTEIFKHGESQYFEWKDSEVNKIVFRAAAILGLNTDDPKLIQFSQGKQQERT